VKIVQRPSAPPDYALAANFPQENYRNFEFNGKLYSSLWPENIDLLTDQEQDELKGAPWFHAGLSRDVSLEILLQQSPGSFLVRQSESNKKYFALSMRISPISPPKLSHYLIEKSNRGYKFKGYLKEFSSLKSLVIHHSVLKEHLQVPLIIPSSRAMRIHDLIVNGATIAQSEHEREKSPTTTLCFRRSKEK
jgi:SH2 domain